MKAIKWAEDNVKGLMIIGILLIIVSFAYSNFMIPEELRHGVYARLTKILAQGEQLGRNIEETNRELRKTNAKILEVKEWLVERIDLLSDIEEQRVIHDRNSI